jgi:hypothetical protein
VGVSPKRWEQEGFLRRSFFTRCLAVAHMLGLSPGLLARLNGTRMRYVASQVQEPAQGKKRSPDTGAAGKH